MVTGVIFKGNRPPTRPGAFVAMRGGQCPISQVAVAFQNGATV